MDETEEMLFLMESDEYYPGDQVRSVSTEDAQDVALFRESLKQEAEETVQNIDLEQNRAKQKTLRKQATRMRRGTKSLKIRQKFADKQISQKQCLLRCQEKIKNTEHLDDTRCLKEHT
jgi:hypothetical protein